MGGKGVTHSGSAQRTEMPVSQAHRPAAPGPAPASPGNFVDIALRQPIKTIAGRGARVQPVSLPATRRTLLFSLGNFELRLIEFSTYL